MTAAPKLPSGVGYVAAKDTSAWEPKNAVWMLLAALFALRFVHLAQDPLLVSPSGMYLTDEGWYSKAAKNLFTLGRADASTDFVPITHTFGYVTLCKLIFDQFGLSLWVLRATSLILSGAGILWLCVSVRARWGQRMALGVAVVLVCNVLLISLTRLALPDTAAFALLTIATAALIPKQRSLFLDLICLSLAAALSFIKTSYLPVTLWLTLICVAVRLDRPMVTRHGVFAVLYVFAPIILGYRWIYFTYENAWAMFSELNLQGRMVNGPVQWILNLGYALGADLWSTGSLGFALLMFVDVRQAGTKVYFRDRKVQALGLLVALNFLSRSLIWYHPPRYGLVTALAILGLSLFANQKHAASRPKHGAAIVGRWVAAFCLGQLSLCIALIQNGHSGDTMRQATQAIVQRIRSHPKHPQVLYGSGTASYVALFYPTLQAVDISDQPDVLCARFEHYGPGFLLVDDRKARDFKLLSHLAQCPGKRRGEPPYERTHERTHERTYELEVRALAEHQVLNNYYEQGPWRLYKLTRTRAPTKQ